MPQDYVIEAIKQQFKGVGFSEHSVLPFGNSFALKESNEKQYTEEIKRLKTKYRDQINIYLSQEADFIPGMSEKMMHLKERLELDYVIGSVHLVKKDTTPDELWFIDGPVVQIYDDGINGLFEGNSKLAVTAYWQQVMEMIQSEEFDVIGHLDKIKMHNKGRWFSETDKWYTDLVNETINLIKENNLLVEINTRGIYKKRSETFFPGSYIIERLKSKDIGVVISSDAHHPSEISLGFDEAASAIKQAGYRYSYIYEDNEWKEFPLDLDENRR